MVMLPVRVEPEVKLELATLAERSGYTLSDIFRAALDRGLIDVRRELGVAAG